MRQSKLFFKTTKDVPKDEVSVNAQLLTKAGFIDKLSAGVYTYLPLGLLTIRKIEGIIREEMQKIGASEILMPSLHPRKNWETTKRWDVEEMFKIIDKKQGLGWTHEEIVTPLAKKIILSFKDLPKYAFQIQTKFRNEPRAKSGLLRGREFIMKDLYSFHKDQEDLDKYYETAKDAYFKVFKRCGIDAYLTLAGGGTFSKFSHEFQAVTCAGEDTIYICKKCKMALNKEIKEDKCPQCGCSYFSKEKAIEVGNIFKLADKYSNPFNLKYKDENGEEKHVLMGCYGIGIGRLMGAVVENSHDEKGIIWPEEISPFKVHLIGLNIQESEKVYNNLQKHKIEVLYDDRKEKSAGEKFTDCDLIGICSRIVVSEKTAKKGCVEIKKRNSGKAELVKIEDIIKAIK